MSAAAPGWWYLLGKTARRHRMALGIAGSFAVTLLVATAVSLQQAGHATREANEANYQRGLATNATAQAVRALRRSEEEKKRAEREARIAEGVTAFLTEDMLHAGDPRGMLDPKTPLDFLLRRSEGTVARRMGAEPLVGAAIHHAIGKAFRAIRLEDAAETNLNLALEIRSRLLGSNDLGTLDTLYELGWLQHAKGNAAKAQELAQRVSVARTAALGPTAEPTLRADYLGAVAVGDQRMTNEGARANLSRDDPVFNEALFYTAIYAHHSGKATEASVLMREDVNLAEAKYGRDHPESERVRSIWEQFLRNNPNPSN